MIRPAQLRDSITVVRKVASGETSDFGDVEYEDDEPETIRAAVTPLDATELEVSRETRLNRYYALVEPEVEVSGIDHVIFEGRRMDLVGEPEIFSQRGRTHHHRLELREVAG